MLKEISIVITGNPGILNGFLQLQITGPQLLIFLFQLLDPVTAAPPGYHIVCGFLR